MSLNENEEARRSALQAMDYVVQGLQTGMYGIVSGYIDHPMVAASIMEGAIRLYLNSLHIYHDPNVCAQYAARLIELAEPFAQGAVTVTEDDWFDSLTPPLLEQLG